MSITAKDIAKLAGVSRSAVSAVLNGHYGKVSLEKREKILSIANDLRYRPNPAALGLARKNTRSVGLLTGPFMSNIYSDLVSKISFLLRERSYNCSVILPADAGQELDAIRHFESSGADGIILASALNDAGKLNLKTPVVSMSPYPGQYEIRADLKFSASQAWEHLRGHGHKNIGFVCPRASVVPLQWEGYLESAGKKGAFRLEVTDNPRFAADFEHLFNDLGLSAWVVTNDLLAGRFMRFLLSRGLRVPEDAAVIGFDGASFTEIISPPLTTVVFPAAKIAEACVSMLMDKIEKNDLSFRSPPVLVKPRLHTGGSCGCKTGAVRTVHWSGQPITLDSAGDENPGTN